MGPDRAHEKSSLSRNRKLMTYPILCKQWHRWREELKDRRKRQWEERAEESSTQPAGKVAKCLTCAHTVFTGLNLGTGEIKDRRTLTHLGNSYWDTVDSV